MGTAKPIFAQPELDSAYRRAADALAQQYLEHDYLTLMTDSATHNQKLLLLYFNATWCPACRNMEEFVFPDIDVKSYIQNRFVFAALDGQRNFDGIEMAQRFEVEIYPTLLIINGKGQLLQRLTGFQGEVELLEKLQSIKQPR